MLPKLEDLRSRRNKILISGQNFVVFFSLMSRKYSTGHCLSLWDSQALTLNLNINWKMVLRYIVTSQFYSHWGKLGVNRGDDFPAHRKMDYSDGWNVMEKQKKPVLSKALHCVRVKKSVLGRRAPLQKWLTAFSTKASFPKHARQANLINRV